MKPSTNNAIQTGLPMSSSLATIFMSRSPRDVNVNDIYIIEEAVPPVKQPKAATVLKSALSPRRRRYR
jgi:hypothetical protein